MKQVYRLSQASDIPGALDSLAQSGRKLPALCTLLCEELLTHLIESGYQNISVALRGVFHHYIEICAPGEPDSMSLTSDGDENLRIESEIRQSLLDQHANSIDFRYVRGVNRFHVFLDGPREEDLCEELYAFYEKADAGETAVKHLLTHRINAFGRIGYDRLFPLKSVQDDKMMEVPVNNARKYSFLPQFIRFISEPPRIQPMLTGGEHDVFCA